MKILYRLGLRRLSGQRRSRSGNEARFVFDLPDLQSVIHLVRSFVRQINYTAIHDSVTCRVRATAQGPAHSINSLVGTDSWGAGPAAVWANSRRPFHGR
jgi:hypothetical protein